MKIDPPAGDTVDARRLPKLAVDAAQSRQHDRHDKAGRLPDAGKNDDIKRQIALDDPVEAEPGKADAVSDLLQTERRIHDPLPDKPGHDEGHRERIEKDRAKGVFEADFLIERDGEKKAEDQAACNEEHAEDHDILQRNQPARGVEQSFILFGADKDIDRQNLAVRERYPDIPDDRDDIGQKHDHKGRQQRQIG